MSIKKLNIKVIILYIIVLLLLFFIIPISIFCITQKKPSTFQLNKAQKLLIVATHPDDEVIEGGGLAIQNNKLGGETVNLIVTKDKNSSYSNIRQSESINVCKFLDTSLITVKFLNFISNKNWPQSKRLQLKDSLDSIIRLIKPDVVIVPLRENGQQEHDIVNEISRIVLKNYPLIKMLQAAEYNPYYIAEIVPQKFMWFIVRLLPFVPYKEPNYGLIPQNQYKLNMNNEDFKLKIQMLSSYKSQIGTIPISQFGYPDLFDSTTVLPTTYHIMGKYFSIITILLFLDIVLFFLCLGICVSCVNKKGTIIILFTIVVLTCLAFVDNKRILDDYIFIVPMVLGFVGAKLFSRLYNKEIFLTRP